MSEDRFLPPESFLARYDDLVYQVYLGDLPETEVRVWMRRRGSSIPVRDYEAYRLLRSIDKVLYDQARRISKHFRERDEV